MGKVVSRRPRVLIDKLMNWKSSHDKQPPANSPSNQLSSPDSVRPSVEISRPSPDGSTTLRIAPPTVGLFMSSPDGAIADRRSSAATYLLCRALIEVINQTTLSSLSHALAVKLESIVFDGTVNQITSEEMHKSSLQGAKWEKATEVLGVLSRHDFAGVCGRYTTVLKSCQIGLNTKGADYQEAEDKTRNMLVGIRQLLPEAEPETTWIQFHSCMGELVELFTEAHGQEPKTQYCQMFEVLFLRLAQRSSIIHDDTKWRRVVTLLNDKLSKLVAKPKYWQSAFSAQVALACVSPNDMFISRWQTLPAALSGRLKEQTNRAVVLKAACRLVWSCLDRKLGTDQSTTKVLDDTVRAIFFSGKRYLLSKEASIAKPLIQLVRIIGRTFPEFAFSDILFPLVQIDLFKFAKDPNYQSLDPDKISIGIRAFLALVNDLEHNTGPPFPFDFSKERGVPDDTPHTPLSPNQGRPVLNHRKGNLVQGDRLSRPVVIANFPAPVRDYYNKFCELLGKILRVCDTAFGGQASLNEKFAISQGRTAFVDAWSFARRDDDEHQAERTGKFGFLDLLHTAVQAIPRCLSVHTPVKGVVDLLCTGTAHTERDIAASSATSLKSIARQRYAELIASHFSMFIFKYDNKYSTVADGGLLGPSHIESTLRLYVELLEIWENELLQNSGLSVPGSAGHHDMSNTKTNINRVETRGLFLLCSPTPRVREYAVTVLELVTRLDKAVRESTPRIFGVLTGTLPSGSSTSFTPREGELSHIEKAKLDKCLQPSNVGNAFIKLPSSNIAEDKSLWHKLFPLFIEAAQRHCPLSVTQTRIDVCNRLAQIQAQIDAQPEEQRGRASTLGSFDAANAREVTRQTVHLPESMVKQYQLYLIFACATIYQTESTGNSSVQELQHVRAGSKSSGNSLDSFNSAPDMFAKVIPMIYSDDWQLRNAVVTGLSAVNEVLYQLLLQSLDDHLRSVSITSRSNNTHARSASSPNRSDNYRIYQTELLQIYEKTSFFLVSGHAAKNDWVMNHLKEFSWSLFEYLRKDDVHEISGLRPYYCGLIKNFFLGANLTGNPEKWMSFARRKAHFVKIEDWFLEITSKEPNMHPQGPLSPEVRRGHVLDERAVARENERLKIATSNAMATLCAGPIKSSPPEPPDQFIVPRLLMFTDRLFDLQGDKPQSTGKKALINLISYNREFAYITETTVSKLYTSQKTATTETYLEVLLEIFSQKQIPRIQEWKLVSALLFTLGHGESAVRMKSARLLRIFEETNNVDHDLRKFDIAISDRTRAVNSSAHFEISRDILRHHHSNDFACSLFSEYSRYFIQLKPDLQRSMVLVLLPWLRVIKLEKVDAQEEGKDTYTANTYMVLMNLLHMTSQTVANLHNEIQALWQGLIIDQHGSNNLHCILDFVTNLCLEHRDPRFIRIVKQVVVFLAHAEAQKDVVEYLMRSIEPKSFCGWFSSIAVHPTDGLRSLPYVVEIKAIFPGSPQQMRMSSGQLSLILLVDLIVSDTSMSVEKLPDLLQIILVLWDHHLSIVQEQAREMLVHLVYAFVISKTEGADVSSRSPSIEELVELIRRNDAKIVWAYGDNSDQFGPYDLPTSMKYVISETIALFSLTVPGIEGDLGRAAVSWAIQCPVRHVACRSLQVYRYIQRPVDHKTLAEILYRLSATIAEAHSDVQAYVAEILRTIQAVAESRPENSPLLSPLYWTSCVALESVHEWDFLAAASILEAILNKCNLLDENVTTNLVKFRPEAWGTRNILTAFACSLCRGCSSKASYDKSINLINKTLIVGCSPGFRDDGYLRLGILANLPRIIHSFEDSTFRASCISPSRILGEVCNVRGQQALSSVFEDYATKNLTKQDLVLRCLANKRIPLFEQMDYDSIEFLMRLLLNPLPWLKKVTLLMLNHLLPRIDAQDHRIRTCGLDLFSPLLRLLQTEHCTEALEVVEHVHLLTGVCKDILYLHPVQSPVEPGRTHRTQVVNAGTLYGIPTATGWSVPFPDQNKKDARENVLSISHKLGKTDEFGLPAALTPEFEFYREEMTHDSYFPEINMTDDVPTVTTLLDPTWDADTSMTQLAAQINDLDDFFAEGTSESTSTISFETDKQAVSKPLQSDISLNNPHGRKLSTAQSLAHRTHAKLGSHGSSISEKSNHHSPILSARSVPQIPPPMSPSAFTTPPSSQTRPPSRPQNSETRLNTRPRMGSRATTAPSGTLQTTPPEKALPTPSVEAEPFSDDDLSAGRAQNDPTDLTPPSRGATPQRPFSTLRNSIKRLAGSEKHRRTNTRAQAEVNASVPPVPSLPQQASTSSDQEKYVS